MIRSNRQPLTAGKRVRFRLEWLAAETLALIIPVFPRRFVVQLGYALGWLAFCGPARRVALQNLDVAFGDTKTPADKTRIARGSLQNFVATILCLFWGRRLTPENFHEFVEIDEASLAHAHTVLRRGKGLVFATLHYGDWELIGLTSAFVGLPLTIVQEGMRNEALQELFARLRGVTGHRVVPQELAATKLYRTLREGGITALLVDLGSNRRGGGLWLDFFGLPAFSSPAFAALALRTGASVLFGYALPLPNGRVRLVFGPEVERQPEDDARALAQRALKMCEDLIRRQPEYWLWSYKRWTPRPTEERGRYPEYSRHIGLRQFHKRHK
jgi:Kdo2-lipid IVA lauroyltransferase/acyltransferase